MSVFFKSHTFGLKCESNFKQNLILTKNRIFDEFPYEQKKDYIMYCFGVIGTAFFDCRCLLHWEGNREFSMEVN